LVEADVAYPTDTGLLAKAIGTMSRSVARIKAAGGATRTRGATGVARRAGGPARSHPSCGCAARSSVTRPRPRCGASPGNSPRSPNRPWLRRPRCCATKSNSAPDPKVGSTTSNEATAGTAPNSPASAGPEHGADTAFSPTISSRSAPSQHETDTRTPSRSQLPSPSRSAHPSRVFQVEVARAFSVGTLSRSPVWLGWLTW
jgi:hypothetical protein